MIPDTQTTRNTYGYGTVNNGASGRDGTELDDAVQATSSRGHEVAQDNKSGGMTLTPSPITQVFLSQLSPGTLYVVRVKVKTVGGWSKYSMPSLPFRTPSAS